MSAGRMEVEGRVFYNRAEYEAALRDLKKIEDIKGKYDLQNPEDIREVYSYLAGGSYRFESAVGDDFDDEIFKLYSDVKDKAPVISRGNAKSAKINRPKKASSGNSKKKLSLADCDDELKAAVEAEIKKQEKRRRIMIAVFSAVALVCFGYFGIYYYQNFRSGNDMEHLAQIKEQNKTPGLAFLQELEKEDESGEENEPEVLEDYKTLLNMNKDLIGWLKIADINIDYPVMQTNDNSYYLDHNFDKKYDKNGCLFLDYQCDIVNRNTNLIIYGHNMQSGNMFGKLSKYSDEEYYKEHPKFEFDTIYEKGAYEIAYVFRSKIYNEDAVVFKYYQFLDVQSELEFNSNMAEMAKISLYDTGITPKYGDELLTLSTCDYQENNGRFVIVARKIK